MFCRLLQNDFVFKLHKRDFRWQGAQVTCGEEICGKALKESSIKDICTEGVEGVQPRAYRGRGGTEGQGQKQTSAKISYENNFKNL